MLDGVIFLFAVLDAEVYIRAIAFFKLMRNLDGLDFQVGLTSFHGILSIVEAFRIRFCILSNDAAWRSIDSKRDT